MKIKIYSEEKGLHNPFNIRTEGGPYILANFLILCVSKVCDGYGITEHALFSKSRKRDLPNIRGAIMSFLFRSKDVQRRWKLSSKDIGSIFSKDHSTVLHFSNDPERSTKCSEPSYMLIKKDIWNKCEKALLENKFNGVNCESMIFSYSEFRDFAHFLGAPEEKLRDFIKLGA